jgi:hypothetical protein
MRQACSASSWRGIGFFFQACSARSRATVKLPDDPRPVPAGMSDMLTISRYGRGPTSTRRRASRTMGCLIWSTVSTSSICEYLTSSSWLKVSCSVM